MSSCEAQAAIRVVEFLSAFPRSPLRTKRGNQVADLVEVNAITTKIWSATRSVFNAAARNDFGNNIGEIPDSEVLVVAAHIESLVMNRLARRIEHGNNSRNNIADMDDGAPWSP